MDPVIEYFVDKLTDFIIKYEKPVDVPSQHYYLSSGARSMFYDSVKLPEKVVIGSLFVNKNKEVIRGKDLLSFEDSTAEKLEFDFEDYVLFSKQLVNSKFLTDVEYDVIKDIQTTTKPSKREIKNTLREIKHYLEFKDKIEYDKVCSEITFNDGNLLYEKLNKEIEKLDEQILKNKKRMNNLMVENKEIIENFNKTIDNQ